ncbi:MAG: photosystem II biogenesis protein Psp29, partial [Cyanobacteria bacterium J083]
MDKLRTVSDTKRDFYTYHNRPINSVYRRAIEELMVEMHLLSVNKDFKPDPFYYLGVVTAFDRFMQGYQPEVDKQSIFDALCKCIQSSSEQYTQSADTLLTATKDMNLDEAVDWLINPTIKPGTENLFTEIQAISQNPHFKYSRLFAIGIYTLLENIDAEMLKDQSQRDPLIDKIAEGMKLPADKMKKDLELYVSNLQKMEQLLIVIQDAIEADRKQREKRAQNLAEKAKKE